MAALLHSPKKDHSVTSYFKGVLKENSDSEEYGLLHKDDLNQPYAELLNLIEYSYSSPLHYWNSTQVKAAYTRNMCPT